METEVVPNSFPSLFWGYTAIWVLLWAYLLNLGHKIRKLEANRDQQQPKS